MFFPQLVQALEQTFHVHWKSVINKETITLQKQILLDQESKKIVNVHG